MLHFLLTAAMLLPLRSEPQQQPQPSEPLKAAIEGAVLRAGTNEPIAQAQLALARISTADGASQPIVAAIRVRTDAQGRFAIADVEPGAYRLSAARNNYVTQEYGERSFFRAGAAIDLAAGQVMKDVVFHLTPAGTVTGQLADAAGRPLPCAKVELFRSVYDATGKRTLQRVTSAEANDFGQYRLFFIPPGRYYVMGQPGSGCDDATEATGRYAPTYYPGTTIASQAASIDVQPGAALQGIDFKLSKPQGVRVRGRVVDAATGQPPQQASLILSPLDRIVGSAKTNTSYDPATGIFEFHEVTPENAYLIVPFGGSGPRNFVRVDVAAADVENVVLTINASFSLLGRIQAEGKLASLPDLDHVAVRLASVESDGGPAASIAKDGTLKIDNLQTGKWRVEVSGLPANAYIKSVRLGADDAPKRTVTIADRVPGALEILVSPNGGEIAGSILDKDGKPMRNIEAVLIPNGAPDRHDLYKTAVSDRNGKFTIRGITPGGYRIFAWEALEAYAYYDPEVLAGYENQGAPIIVAESSKAEVEVQAIPALTPAPAQPNGDTH